MKALKNHTVEEFLDTLSAKTPAPGGGAACALTAGMGAGLLAMVARYSAVRAANRRAASRIERLAEKCEAIKRELCGLIDEDAAAYSKVREAASKGGREKAAAERKARAVQQRVCRLCYQAIRMAPDLVKNGNPYLIADVEVAAELLLAAFNSGIVLVKA
jgi:methenyltetrahydrofolate cyclohydrolase